jgi:hypothetical protein
LQWLVGDLSSSIMPDEAKLKLGQCKTTHAARHILQ